MKKRVLSVTAALLLFAAAAFIIFTQKSEGPLTLEQSVSNAILEQFKNHYADKPNIELHKIRFIEETGGVVKVYASYQIYHMKWARYIENGWTDEPVDRGVQFIDSAGGAGAIICSFTKDKRGNYKLKDFLDVDPKGNTEEYEEFMSKTEGKAGNSAKASDILFGTSWADPISMSLGKYLPEGIFTEEYMPGFKEIFASDGAIVYYWNKTKSLNKVIRKIELELRDEGLARFHFKDYGLDDGYVYEAKEISGSEALEMVQSFAADFWEDGEELLFANGGQGYMTLYNPGVTENWAAERGGKTYNVMVNLLFGYIIYADIQGD